MIYFILYCLIAVLITLVVYRNEWIHDTGDALAAGIGWIVIIPCWLVIILARYNFKRG